MTKLPGVWSGLKALVYPVAHGGDQRDLRVPVSYGVLTNLPLTNLPTECIICGTLYI